MCEAIVLSSSNSLISSIQAAGLFKNLAKIYLTAQESYLSNYESFTKIALNLIDENGDSAFSEGIRTLLEELKFLLKLSTSEFSSSAMIHFSVSHTDPDLRLLGNDAIDEHSMISISRNSIQKI